MIVFDLKCGAHGHVFEAWFANSDSFEDQKSRGLLSCPICGASDIQKAVMAAAIPKKGNSLAERSVSLATISEENQAKEILTALAKAQAKLLEGSQWVGRNFDSQARAMDAGEVERSTIHGEVTAAEAKALIEDGIAVTPLPLPVVPPEKRN
ncbi:DUF1178 family protein [Aquisediminimonas profunda]|uniref:DUF1178 family protein n=1 Tax=Aquisediminimonas profunda TaxID=1550733 RepID=UPI001C6376D7|nr:DUF1178 family protein [Aquisediminimonas profunda]